MSQRVLTVNDQFPDEPSPVPDPLKKPHPIPEPLPDPDPIARPS